jgi:hypothetical protein
MLVFFGTSAASLLKEPVLGSPAEIDAKHIARVWKYYGNSFPVAFGPGIRRARHHRSLLMV